MYLSKEWDYEKNINLNIADFTKGSTKKVYWKCDLNHSWEASISKRVAGRGCPYCSGHKVSFENSLQFKNPELSREWHPTKNGKLTPLDVTYGSGKKVWWIDKHGHEWESSIIKRAQGKGCPYCSGKKVGYGNSLYDKNIELSNEWHYSKNGNLKPTDVTEFSNKYVWWICQNGHEWESSISNRARGKGCPQCSSRVSTVPKLIYESYKKYHSLELEKRIADNQVDLYFKDLKLIIEYDGVYYHKEKIEYDINKSLRLIDLDYKIIRIREYDNKRFLPIILNKKIKTIYFDSGKVNDINVINSFFKNLNKKIEQLVCETSMYDEIESIREYNEISRKRVPLELSVGFKYPLLRIEWHPTKNGKLTPYDVMKGSNKKVWWIDKHGHEWDATINSRVNGRGCPYCSGKKVGYGNSLGDVYPELAKEFDLVKNNGLTPFDISHSSNKSVWWKNSKNKTWKSSISNRIRKYKNAC